MIILYFVWKEKRKEKKTSKGLTDVHIVYDTHKQSPFRLVSHYSCDVSAHRSHPSVVLNVVPSLDRTIVSDHH